MCPQNMNVWVVCVQALATSGPDKMRVFRGRLNAGCRTLLIRWYINSWRVKRESLIHCEQRSLACSQPCTMYEPTPLACRFFRMRKFLVSATCNPGGDVVRQGQGLVERNRSKNVTEFSGIPSASWAHAWARQRKDPQSRIYHWQGQSSKSLY